MNYSVRVRLVRDNALVSERYTGTVNIRGLAWNIGYPINLNEIAPHANKLIREYFEHLS